MFLIAQRTKARPAGLEFSAVDRGNFHTGLGQSLALIEHQHTHADRADHRGRSAKDIGRLAGDEIRGRAALRIREGVKIFARGDIGDQRGRLRHADDGAAWGINIE